MCPAALPYCPLVIARIHVAEAIQMGAANLDTCKKSTTKLVDEFSKELEKIAKQLEEWKKQRKTIEEKLETVGMTYSSKIANVECPTDAEKDLAKLAAELSQKAKQKLGLLKDYVSIDADVEYNK